MIIHDLIKKKLIHPPSWLADNTVYLSIVGSYSYGVNNDLSDMDLKGFVIPLKEMVFPNLKGDLPIFDYNNENYKEYFFRDWEHHNVVDPMGNKGKGQNYDFTVYNIVQYFKFLVEGNLNIVDSLFTRQECVIHATQVANMVRENRHLFLHKGLCDILKNYAFAHLHKMKSKQPVGKRVQIREKYGYDAKFGENVIRSLNECEQILLTGDLDLMKNNEQLKAIRRGEVGEEEVVKWASDKERLLEKLRIESKLQERPPVAKIKQLLFDCLEQHYGSLEKAISNPDKLQVALDDIKKIIDRLNS